MAKKVLKLEDYERHITLLAKGHYGTLAKDNVTKLKLLVAHISGIELEYISRGDIYGTVVDTFFLLAETGPQRRLKAFMTGLAGKFSPALSFEDMINSMIGFIAVTKCSGRSDGVEIDIGLPDPEIMRKLRE